MTSHGWKHMVLSGLLLASCSAEGPNDVASPGAVGAGTSPLTYTPPAVRQQVDLGAGWRFLRSDAAQAQLPAFDDSTWSAVSIPHTWNARDGQDGGNDYYRGIGWYRRHYVAPAGFAGKKVWIQFDGASTVADVWVNGTYVGQHKGGFARFRFDVTSLLKLGADNVIAVKVDNARNANIPPLTADFTFFGGIYRNVSLHVTDELSIRMLDLAGPGVYLRQRQVSAASATVDVTTKTWNNSARTRRFRSRVVVADPTGAVVADTLSAPRTLASKTGDASTQTITLANPHLWNGAADPYQYRASVEIVDDDTGVIADSVTEPLGLRSFRLDPNAGFVLNGSRLPLHGVNRHQDRLDKGWAIGQAEHARDFDLMAEMGVNALRTAHYQQDQAVYDLADRHGFVVWAEIPLVDAITASAEFRANAEQQLREMIRQDYNHPSIVFWGIGNEQRVDDSGTNSLLESLARAVDSEDPDRLSVYAHNGGTGSALITHSETAGFNKYFGWYSGASSDFGPWADNLHRAQPARAISISEYGAGASTRQHAENPPKPTPDSDWHPEEYQALYHESHWAQMAARPYLWGTFVWNMFDFAADQRSEGDTYGRNDKGLVTYDRITRKDAFYWYKANWTDVPFVYITSRRWTERTSPTTTIKAYGTVDSARLTVNGTPVGGAVVSNHHAYTWPDVTLAPGANTVTISGTRAGATYTDTVIWNVVR
ncbi:glycoside hydrolase family 2 protein [Pendulispora albinea]|uniref:Beta galactosidase jelly roll domain-containing protein n=1 Tax=Pendulispora albinea TaxID=2741071 RepID=A0ABZ2LYZ6_9BACT